MNLVLWIVQAVLALIFLGAGTVKLVQSRDRLVKTLGGWVEDVPAGLIKAIGALEILAAIGLILPPALGIFPVFHPWPQRDWSPSWSGRSSPMHGAASIQASSSTSCSPPWRSLWHGAGSGRTGSDNADIMSVFPTAAHLAS